MINIVVVDDSLFFREVLVSEIEKTGKVKVIGEAGNGVEALELLETVKPDIVILDYEMPIMDGLECLKHIKAKYSFPVFILSALTSEGADATIRALEHGATDFFQKPTGGQSEFSETLDVLVKKFKTIVFKERLTGIQKKSDFLDPDVILTKRAIDVIAIGSSTGGVEAIMQIIPTLPKNTKPILWVQHMPENFTRSLAQRLNDASVMRVKEAEDGERLEHGTCYLAPGDHYMQISKDGSEVKIHIHQPESNSQHCLSCDMLFSSIADCFSKKAMGIVLTGMGKDGAAGLENMHKKGALVIGQNEESCAVYGMPRAAYLRGAVDIELDIKDVAGAITKITGL